MNTCNKQKARLAAGSGIGIGIALGAAFEGASSAYGKGKDK